MERLPQLNYSILKDNALRKKLSELGIPNGGPRALLIRRHTEWVNLVNANCDSLKPRTKRELLHELDIWDKTQGRQIANGSNGAGNASSVMNKDFNGTAWAASHDEDFQKLIAKARIKASSNDEVIKAPNEIRTTPVPDSAGDDTSTLPDADLIRGEGNVSTRTQTAIRRSDKPLRAGQCQPTEGLLVDLNADA